MRFWPRVAEAELDADPESLLRALVWVADGESGVATLSSSLPAEGTGAIEAFEHALGGRRDDQPSWLTEADLEAWVAPFRTSGFFGPVSWYRNFDVAYELTCDIGNEVFTMPTAFVSGAADPVIAGQVVYTGNQSGRAVALEASSGERIWTADQGVYGMPLPVGGSVFFLTDQAQLVRLDAGSGTEIWTTVLPYYTARKPARRRGIHTHHGPVLAGGRLWVASDDGALRAFSPENGVMVAELDLPGGGATPPVVAGGTMYVVSDKGQLHAFR